MIMQREDQTYYWVFIFILTLCGMLMSSSSLGQDQWTRVMNLEGRWKFTIGDKAIWSERYYNDREWETISVPARWEEEGFNGYDGYAWYRTSFMGSSLQREGDGLTLFLGRIDDVDEVYFNGRKIGASGGFPPHYHTAYNVERMYFIPNALIDYTARNVIAVRVFDEGLEGGIVDGDVGLYRNRTDDGLLVNLRGMWEFKTTGIRDAERFKRENALEAMKEQLGSNGWTQLSVPGKWEESGAGYYDGSAWYKKEFNVPKQIAGEDLVLLLGKIDDSDITYLNGKRVGATFDQWDKLRTYYLKAEDLIPGGTNVLLINVNDTGGFGGIYEGPVGLMKQSEFTRFMRWKY